MPWMLGKEVWPSVCVYWNLAEPWTELCCRRTHREMGMNHCKVEHQSRRGSWAQGPRQVLNKHRVMILER